MALAGGSWTAASKYLPARRRACRGRVSRVVRRRAATPPLWQRGQHLRRVAEQPRDLWVVEELPRPRVGALQLDHGGVELDRHHLAHASTPRRGAGRVAEARAHVEHAAALLPQRAQLVVRVSRRVDALGAVHVEAAQHGGWRRRRGLVQREQGGGPARQLAKTLHLCRREVILLCLLRGLRLTLPWSVALPHARPPLARHPVEERPRHARRPLLLALDAACATQPHVRRRHLCARRTRQAEVYGEGAEVASPEGDGAAR
mmetsp:Transcript_9568/g.31724  ORF Transcript_9568/g.31724 Transcript_9568/m.31724 type:complete len:260 (+) Transcript_9568:90-869(+)